MISSMNSKQLIGIAALAHSASVEEGPVRVLPLGNFSGVDGRPKQDGLPHWHLSAKAAATIATELNRRESELVIDYEHQTLRSKENGKPAPASGWGKRQWEVRNDGTRDDGLYTSLSWTEPAKQMIAAGEYRYISPTFPYDRKTGEVLALHSIALTNTPALDELGEQLLAAAAQNYQLPKTDMNEEIKRLLEGLGLDPEKASKDEVDKALAQVDAAKAMTTEPDTDTAADGQSEAQGAGDGADKGAGEDDDLAAASTTAIAAMQKELAALKSELVKREREELIAAGLQSGKLLPAMKGWAKKVDMAALTSYLADAAPVAALNQQQSTGMVLNSGDKHNLSSEEREVIAACGYDTDEYVKAKEGK